MKQGVAQDGLAPSILNLKLIIHKIHIRTRTSSPVTNTVITLANFLVNCTNNTRFSSPLRYAKIIFTHKLLKPQVVIVVHVTICLDRVPFYRSGAHTVYTLHISEKDSFPISYGFILLLDCQTVYLKLHCLRSYIVILACIIS